MAETRNPIWLLVCVSIALTFAACGGRAAPEPDDPPGHTLPSAGGAGDLAERPNHPESEPSTFFEPPALLCEGADLATVDNRMVPLMRVEGAQLREDAADTTTTLIRFVSTPGSLQPTIELELTMKGQPTTVEPLQLELDRLPPAWRARIIFDRQLPAGGTGPGNTAMKVDAFSGTVSLVPRSDGTVTVGVCVEARRALPALARVQLFAADVALSR